MYAQAAEATLAAAEKTLFAAKNKRNGGARARAMARSVAAEAAAQVPVALDSILSSEYL